VREQTADRRSTGKDLIDRVVNCGTKGFPPEVARRLVIVNISAAMASLASLGHVIINATIDADLLAPVIAIQLGAIPVWAAVPFLHRFGAMTGEVVLGTTLTGVLIALTYMLGRGSGIHLYFLAYVACALLFFGAEQLAVVFGWLIAAVALHVVAEFLFTPQRAIFPLDPDALHVVYAYSALMSSAITFAIIFYVFQMISRAEAMAEHERQRSEVLLRNVLPDSIARRLKERPDEIIADSFGDVTVLFADIVGFTSKATTLSPDRVVSMLNEAFTSFDGLVDRYGLEKIKTIGDAYMVVAGLPEPRPDGCEAVADLALDMIEIAKNIRDETGRPISIRIGINSGPVVAGVIGRRKFSYDVWGDTVNMAARMESHGVPDAIQVTRTTYEILKDRYAFEAREPVEIKGKGVVAAYILTGKV
jgi:class 3 adenylate cyclase